MENNSIFISYSHKDKNGADYIDEYFKLNGVILKRDVREVGYSNSFIDFMNSIRENDYVIMLISRNYLFSVNCMYEVIQVMKEMNFDERIHPIIINSELLYSLEGNIDVVQYWTKKYEDLKSKIEMVDITDSISLAKDLKKIQEIKSNIGDFLNVIKEHKYMSLEEHKESNFNDIFKALGVDQREQMSSNDEIKYHNKDYYILKEDDVSHASAKRFSVTVLLNRNMSKSEIRDVTLEVTEMMKKSKYARNAKVEERFTGKNADVVWIFFARDLVDSNNANWICQTQWVSSKLIESARPMILNGDDEINGIVISWNKRYVATKEYYEKHTATKTEILKDVNEIIPKLLDYSKNITDMFMKFKTGEINEDTLIQYGNMHKENVTDLYLESTNRKIPPIELENYIRVVDKVAASVDNLFLYYCDSGMKTWESKNRKWLFENTLQTLNKDIESLTYENEKIRK